MKVSKSELKPKLFGYLRKVSETGRELVITEHGKPVLKIIPISESEEALYSPERHGRAIRRADGNRGRCLESGGTQGMIIWIRTVGIVVTTNRRDFSGSLAHRWGRLRAQSRGGFSISVELLHTRRKGSTSIENRSAHWVHQCELSQKIRFVPVDNEITRISVQLPKSVPEDPANRLIVATAISLGGKLISKDAKLRASHVVGHFQ